MTVDAGSESFVPAHNGATGGASDGRSILARLDVALGSLVEMLAAGLVAAEIVILFGGVASRYVFDRPLIWSDELASTLFLWLAMLGAVIAFRLALPAVALPFLIRTAVVEGVATATEVSTIGIA